MNNVLQALLSDEAVRDTSEVEALLAQELSVGSPWFNE
jgi:hypothetical protein